MDKSWMKKNRLFEDYELGVECGTLSKHERDENVLKKENIDEILDKEETLEFKEGTHCRLALGSIDNVVVAGTIFESGRNDGNVKVCIDVMVDDDSRLPIPTHGGNDILSQEIGSHILWPQSLVISDNEKEIKHSRELFRLASGKSPTQPAPVSLTFLTREINYIGRAIQMIISKDVFGHEHKLFIMVEDVQKLFHMEPTTTLCIDAYTTFLHRSLGNENESSPYKFLDAGATSITNLSKENRMQVLTKRLSELELNQLLMFSYHSGDHWTLIVMSPAKNMTFFLDSMRNRLTDDILSVITMAVRNIQKKPFTLKRVPCPKQPNAIECGYYVMRFMRDIVFARNTKIPECMKGAPQCYTQEHLDVIRRELHVGARVEGSRAERFCNMLATFCSLTFHVYTVFQEESGEPRRVATWNI